MGILENARTRFIRNCRARDVDPSAGIAVRPLSSDEAIGPKAGAEFVIKKGKERVIEAAFSGARGQAFTGQPTSWSGRLEDLCALDLSQVPHRAVFVAGMNAVLRALDEAKRTVHCTDEDPMRCGPELARTLDERFGAVRVGLIGLQPSILAAEGWGAFSQKREATALRARVELRWGRLHLKTLALAIPEKAQPRQVSVKVAGATVGAGHVLHDGRLTITLASETVLHPDKAVEVLVAW